MKAYAHHIFKKLFIHRSMGIGVTLVFAVFFAALLSSLLTHFQPDQMYAQSRFLSPDSDHWFGTDSFGRDLFSRVVFGARTSLEIGLGVTLITGLLGGSIGAISGYIKALDNPIMRLMDALMAFPTILLAIAISTALGPSGINVIIAISITNAPRAARIMRASVLSVRELDFVQAAYALGASRKRVILVHIIPNSLAPFLVQLSFVFSAAILSEAILSFLGVGIPPTVPTWGNIISEGRNYMWEAPWITIFPGLAIVISVLGLNLIGDGLRDLLDPRQTTQGR